MPAPRFVLSPEAPDDLAAIAGYIASQSGRLRAQRAVERISRSLAAIAYSPNAGRRCDDLEGSPFVFPVAPWLVL